MFREINSNLPRCWNNTCRAAPWARMDQTRQYLGQRDSGIARSWDRALRNVRSSRLQLPPDRCRQIETICEELEKTLACQFELEPAAAYRRSSSRTNSNP